MAEILVIDCEPVVRSVITRILQKAGHSVNSTGEFNQALILARRFKVEIILTNVFLQGITGHDAMEKLKETFPHIPVLMVSGLPDAEIIEQWTGKTGFDVFPKPFMPEALIAKVDEMLSGLSQRLSSSGSF